MARVRSIGLTDSNELALDDFNVYRVATVNLTAAQMLALSATPVTIIPNVAPNQMVIVDYIQVQFKAGTVQYAGGGAITFVYQGGAVSPHALNIPAATITSASSSNNQLPGITTVIQPPSGKGITMSNATAAFTAGNGTMTVTACYSITTLQ